MNAIRSAASFAAIIMFGVLFQNCAAAPPPDISHLRLSSNSVGAPDAGVVAPPTATATPRPVATATPRPVATATPRAVTTATPAPVTQTYSWKIGSWSFCNSGRRTRTVSCANSLGTVVAYNYCSTAKPATSQACSSYACTATKIRPFFFFPRGICSYKCVGAITYRTYATDATKCSPNPIGVAGTETGYLGTSSTTRVNRPFTQCRVTKNFDQTLKSIGQSVCE